MQVCTEAAPRSKEVAMQQSDYSVGGNDLM